MRRLEPLRTRRPPRAARRQKNRQRTAASAAAKNIAELGENIFHVHVAAAKTAAAVHALVAETVVTGPFFLIAQYFVGFGCFFKFIFGGVVVRVFIRVKFNGNFAVCFFNFLRTGLLSQLLILRNNLSLPLTYAPITTFAKRITLSFR